ncbi:MAG: DNA-directed RNA polymerase subunit omega [Thermoplasmata archaeon]
MSSKKKLKSKSKKNEDESNIYTSKESGKIYGGQELGDYSENLDIDPDDEVDYDTNEDEKYDPVNEGDVLEDPDEETEVEEIGEIDVSEEYVETKTCHYKNLEKDFIFPDDDDSTIYSKMEFKKIPDEERESDPIMTYYEMVRIIGTRAQQFNLGAKPLIKVPSGLHPAKIAYLELIAKMTPYIIRRHLPGKKYEEWRIDELEIVHKIDDEFFVPENFTWNIPSKDSGQN